MAKSKLGLRQAAMSAPIAPTQKRSWLQKLDDETRQEFIEFIQEWHAGGELAARYPSRRSLILFLRTQQFTAGLGRSALSDTIAAIIEGRHGG